jgi:GT2 family glycosyltransferase
MTGTSDNVSFHVAIAMVGFRNADDIRDCLGTLAGSTHAGFSIHICENGGTAAYDTLAAGLDGLVEFDSVTDPPPIGRVLRWQRGRLVQGGQTIYLYEANDNLGFAGGVNIGLASAQHTGVWDALWLLNPDTEPDPGALAALVAKASQDDYAMIGARLVLKATDRIQLYGGRWRPWLARGFNIGMNAPKNAMPDIAAIESEMSYVNGAALFATRRFIEAAGPMEERYFLYVEEIDWCFRRGRMKLGYAHDAIVYHAHGTTIGSHRQRAARSALSVYLDERNKLLFTRQFFPLRYPLVVLTTFLLLFQYLAHRAHANFRVALAGWWAGIRGEVGVPERFRA